VAAQRRGALSIPDAGYDKPDAGFGTASQSGRPGRGNDRKREFLHPRAHDAKKRESRFGMRRFIGNTDVREIVLKPIK
jgi:hypothetical protein